MTMKWLSFRMQFGYAKDALEKSNWEKAKNHFEKAIGIDPSKTEASLGLAQAFGSLNEKENAVRILEDLIQREPDSAYAYLMLGRFLGDEEKLQKSVELDPKNPSGWHELGKIYVRGTNEAKALAAFQKAAELDPTLALSRFDEVKKRIES